MGHGVGTLASAMCGTLRVVLYLQSWTDGDGVREVDLEERAIGTRVVCIVTCRGKSGVRRWE